MDRWRGREPPTSQEIGLEIIREQKIYDYYDMREMWKTISRFKGTIR